MVFAGEFPTITFESLRWNACNVEKSLPSVVMGGNGAENAAIAASSSEVAALSEEETSSTAKRRMSR